MRARCASQRSIAAVDGKLDPAIWIAAVSKTMIARWRIGGCMSPPLAVAHVRPQLGRGRNEQPECQSQRPVFAGRVALDAGARLEEVALADSFRGRRPRISPVRGGPRTG